MLRASRGVRGRLGIVFLVASVGSSPGCRVPADGPAPETGVDREFEPDTGFFVGVSAIRTDIGGDFSKSWAFEQSDFLSTTTTVIPELDPGYGGKLALGWRWTRAAVEMSYQQTRHQGSDLAGTTYDAKEDSLDVNGRLYLPSPSPRVKPSLLAGLSIPDVEIQGSSSTHSFGSIDVSDVTYSGWGVNLGLGVDVYLTRHWSVDLNVIYRWTWLDESLGSESPAVSRTMRGREWVLGLGTSWTF
jgi:outer membrane protein W